MSFNNASSSVVGFGSQIAYATITSGNAGSYTMVAQTQDISSPEMEVGDVKTTNNSSPNNSHEYRPGLTEPGEVEFDVVYFKTGHQTLLGMCGNGIIYAWQETFSDTPASICTFPGYVKSSKVEGKTEDDALKGKLKIKLTGPCVWVVIPLVIAATHQPLFESTMISKDTLLKFTPRTEEIDLTDLGIEGSITIRELSAAEVKTIAKAGDAGNATAVRLATTIGGEPIFDKSDDIDQLSAAVFARVVERITALSSATKKPTPTV